MRFLTNAWSLKLQPSVEYLQCFRTFYPEVDLKHFFYHTSYNISNSDVLEFCYKEKYRPFVASVFRYYLILVALRFKSVSVLSSWLQIQRSRVRLPAIPDFPGSSVSGTGSTQLR
jgi:hypothetical protein